LRPRGLCESCDSILWSGTSRTILDYIVPDSECQSYFIRKGKTPRTVFGTGSRCIAELLLGSLILLDEDAQRTDGDLDALRHLGIGHDGGGAAAADGRDDKDRGRLHLGADDIAAAPCFPTGLQPRLGGHVLRLVLAVEGVLGLGDALDEVVAELLGGVGQSGDNVAVGDGRVLDGDVVLRRALIADGSGVDDAVKRRVERTVTDAAVPTRMKVSAPQAISSSRQIAVDGQPMPVETTETGTPLSVPVQVLCSRLCATSFASSK